MKLPPLTIRTIAIGAAIVLAGLGWRDAAIRLALASGGSPPPALAAADPRLALAAVDAAIDADPASAAEHSGQRSALARAVLRAGALDARALRDLALAGAPDTEIAAAAPGLALAARVSRRDAPAQNALLRIAAERGDYAASLAHLDVMLTVDPGVRDVFQDAMMEMLADPNALEALARYGDRPWFRDFAMAALPRIEPPGRLAALLVRSAITDLQAREVIAPGMLDRLAAAGDYAAAQDFAVRFAGADRATLGDFRLSAPTASPALGPFGWRLADSPIAEAVLVRGGAVEAQFQAGSPVILLERTMLLAAGTYMLEQRVSQAGDDRDIELEWRAACIGDNEEFLRQQVPVADGATTYRTRVTVPAQCPAQRWRLHALADDTQAPAGFTLAGLRLIRQ